MMIYYTVVHITNTISYGWARFTFDHKFKLNISDLLRFLNIYILIVRVTFDADRHIRTYTSQTNEHKRTEIILLIFVRIFVGRKSLIWPIS